MTPEQLDKKFKKLRRTLCCVTKELPSQDGHAGEVLTTDGTNVSWQPDDDENSTASTATTSKYLLSESSDVFSFSGTKVSKEIENRIPLYKVPAANLTNGYDTFTKAGAMSTATITQVGNYDNIVVGNEVNPRNSYFQPPRFFSASPIYVHMRVKVLALGATPVIGIRTLSAPGPYVNFTNAQGFLYINLLTGAATTSFTSHTTVSYNGFSGAVAVNDVIDVYFEWRYVDKMVLRVSKDKAAAETTETTLTWSPSNSGAANIFYPCTILADGTYQVFEHEIGIVSALSPKIALIGDSLMSGAAIPYSQTICSQLEEAIPYKVANFSAPAAYIVGQKAALKDLISIKPQVVFISAVLEALFGNDVDGADGQHATWVANFGDYINTLINAGIEPILLIPSNTPLYPDSRCTALVTYWTTTFPGRRYVQRLSTDGGFDGTGFHYNQAANAIIVSKLITELEALGVL